MMNNGYRGTYGANQGSNRGINPHLGQGSYLAVESRDVGGEVNPPEDPEIN